MSPRQHCFWVTRSEPGAGRLRLALIEAGWHTLVEPVLEIQPLDPPTLADPVDIQIFLSEHAVRLAPASWLSYSCARFAVGQTTAQALADRGVIAQQPEIAKSEGLVQMPELESVNGRRIALVTGRGGRELLARTLESRGAEVLSLALYERRQKQQITVDLTPVTAIVVSSGDGFRAASRLWFAANGPHNVRQDVPQDVPQDVRQDVPQDVRPDVPVFVPSARVAALAPELGFINTVICDGADPASVVKRICGWLEQAGS